MMHTPAPAHDRVPAVTVDGVSAVTVDGVSAISAMTAAKACYDTIPDSYGGKGHLGLTIAALDQLVLRVSTLRGRVAAVRHG